MNLQTLQKAVAMAGRAGHILVATADAQGLPHLAAAGKMWLDEEGHLAVGAWFCPGTVGNLRDNRRIAVVVWDPATDTGYQLLGQVEQILDLAVLDGYAPEQSPAPPIPQVERELQIRVDKILHFSHGPHRDVEES